MRIEVGTDIISINRIKKLIDKFGDKFIDRFLDEDEKKLAKKIESIAGFWAAKEAISKAIGTGIGKELSFLDIKIEKNVNNKPYFKIYKKNFNIISSSISISHDSGFAIATAFVVIKDINE